MWSDEVVSDDSSDDEDPDDDAPMTDGIVDAATLSLHLLLMEVTLKLWTANLLPERCLLTPPTPFSNGSLANG